MMKKYRKKPVEIEAVQYNGHNSWEIEQWSNKQVYSSPVLSDNPYNLYLQIKTLEGVMTAIPGDWVIKGVAGEFYPCKNDIFLLTYEEV